MIPGALHGIKHKNWLYTLIKPLQHVHNLFYAFYDTKRFFLKHTSQTVYVEHFLNAKYNIDNPSASHVPAHDYNATNKDIYIVNNDIVPQYLFNLSESIPDDDVIYIFNKDEEYNPALTYNSGDTATYDFQFWECNTNGTTGAWNETKWDKLCDEFILYNKNDVSLGYNFTIYVPSNLLLAKPWSDMSMITTMTQVKAFISGTIEKFKFANITYELIEY